MIKGGGGRGSDLGPIEDPSFVYLGFRFRISFSFRITVRVSIGGRGRVSLGGSFRARVRFCLGPDTRLKDSMVGTKGVDNQEPQ